MLHSSIDLIHTYTHNVCVIWWAWNSKWMIYMNYFKINVENRQIFYKNLLHVSAFLMIQWGFWRCVSVEHSHQEDSRQQPMVQWCQFKSVLRQRNFQTLEAGYLLHCLAVNMHGWLLVPTEVTIFSVLLVLSSRLFSSQNRQSTSR